MATELTWHEVSSRSKPCPICYKSDWCSLSSDGLWAICRRIDNGQGTYKVDQAGADYWVYRLDGNHTSTIPILDFPINLSGERANPETLNRVYQALLADLSLETFHKENLLQRGLTDQEIKSRGYRTLPNRGRSALTRRLVERFGAEICSKVPGLYIKEQNGNKWWSLAGSPGILIPVRDISGRIIALKIRADEVQASNSRYLWLSSSKHNGPGPGAQVHVPLFQGETHTVRTTEGELKADVATVFTGILTLSAPGVSLWRPTLPILEELQAKTILLAFDMDMYQKASVAGALQRAFETLSQRGFEVAIEVWPENLGKGIDDLLKAGHKPQIKTGDKARDFVAEIVTKAATNSKSESIKEEAGQKEGPNSLEEAQKITTEALSRVKEDPGAVFEPNVRKAWKILKDEDPMSWARAKRDLKKAGVSLTELNQEIKKDQQGQNQTEHKKAPETEQNYVSPKKGKIGEIFADPSLEPMNVPLEWLMTEEGISQIKFKLNGDPLITHVSYYPIIITAIARDIDTEDEHLTLKYKKEGKIYTLTADRRILSEQRRITEISEKGFPVNSVNAKQIIRYLEDFEAVNIAHLAKSSITHGFGHKYDTKGNPIYFLPDKTYNTDEILTFHGRGPGDYEFFKALQPKGKLKDWVQIIKNYCVAHDRVMFALYAGFAVPLLKLFGCSQSFWLHSYGMRSCGKTTQNQIAASIYGNPAKLILQWNHITQVAAEQLAALFNGLPIFLDDSQNADEKKISTLIYLIANGIGKARGYKLGGLQKTLSWLTIVFSTGEQKFFELTKKGGAEARSLSFLGSPFGPENDRSTGKEVRDLKHLIHQNYGTAIRPFLDHIYSLPPESLMKEYEHAYKLIEQQITGAGEVHRHIDYFASILAAGRLAEDVFGFGGKPYEICKRILTLFQNEGVTDMISEAMEDVISWINSNDNLYDVSGKVYEEQQGGYGVRHGVKNPGEYVAIFPHILRDFLARENYSPSMIFQGWKDRGWIQSDRGHSSTLVSFRGKNVRMIKIFWKIFYQSE